MALAHPKPPFFPRGKPMPINQTHDPNLRSWVESANDPASDFPIQNLPLCVVRDDSGAAMIGTVIGDRFLNLRVLAEHGLLKDADPDGALVSGPLVRDTLNALATVPGAVARLRQTLVRLLRADTPDLRDNPTIRDAALRPLDAVRPTLSFAIGDYTDFYASKHHATNVGSMFRPDNPLLPNYRHVPIGYHGRASSIVPSGTPVRRPMGQTKADDAAEPTFGPCRMLDYEMEMGVFIGRGNELGRPIPIEKAREHMLGMCIVNDWSARDLQKWEYQPLGPFLAKNFATTISPFVVTMEALEPFRVPGPERSADDPQPLPYLRGPADGGLDITVEVHLATKQMRDRGLSPVRISKGNFRHMYWTLDQMVTHHASNGCNLQPGDLLASGTISGPTPESRGCLLELTWDGPGKPRKPVSLPTGETRTFLQDGDEVIMRAYCERDGFRRIGFGECRGIIEPAQI
jgi:fumarylacetoacetase